MNRKLRALDLFCGAGGVTKGLQRAGFYVTGVDIRTQPRYCGDEFVQADALEFPIGGFDFVWASPPCQAFSRMSSCRDGLRQKYPDLIEKTRRRLVLNQATSWIIENVEGSPLINPVMLCGAMFGLATYRHRLFEAGFGLEVPVHPVHTIPTSKAGHWRPGTYVSVAGHCSPMNKCREAMGIDWMNRDELTEAIPPAYSEFIGREMIEHLERKEKEQGNGN
jgi:DNA (cytosine-5)-methyltransferase 1